MSHLPSVNQSLDGMSTVNSEGNINTEGTAKRTEEFGKIIFNLSEDDFTNSLAGLRHLSVGEMSNYGMPKINEEEQSMDQQEINKIKGANPPLSAKLSSDSSTSGAIADVSASDFLTSVDALFDLLTTDDQTVSVADLFSTLRRCGLRTNDPRLRGMMTELAEFEKKEHKVDITLLILNKEMFRQCVMRSFTLVRKALRMEMIIPRWTEFCNQVSTIYDHCKHIQDGHVANYIPQLARSNPELWAVSLCTVDGQRAAWGDKKAPFCLQAMSSVLSYATVRHELGADEVHKYIGQEPSGRLFNDICLDHNGRPHNPMINSGAFVSAALVKRGDFPAAKFDHTMTMARKFCGGSFVGFDNSTFVSERSTSDRNHALAYFMRENGCFPEGTDLQETIDFFLQLCSLQSNTDSLAVFASTLANGGICPLTGEMVISMSATRDTLALMYSCGLYAHSGQFSFRVGLPSKSGVSGVMIVVVPNVMGICLYSPKLTTEGNSVRAVKFCEEFVDTFSFHNYDIVCSDNSDRDPRRQTNDSQRAQIMKVMFSSQAGDLSALKRYALREFSLSCSDYDNRTPLHMAAAEGHAHIISFLLDCCKVKVDPKDRWDRTPFDDALEFGHEDCARLLDEYKRKHLEESGNDDHESFVKQPRKISVMYAAGL